MLLKLTGGPFFSRTVFLNLQSFGFFERTSDFQTASAGVCWQVKSVLLPFTYASEKIAVFNNLCTQQLQNNQKYISHAILKPNYARVAKVGICTAATFCSDSFAACSKALSASCCIAALHEEELNAALGSMQLKYRSHRRIEMCVLLLLLLLLLGLLLL